MVAGADAGANAAAFICRGAALRVSCVPGAPDE